MTTHLVRLSGWPIMARGMAGALEATPYGSIGRSRAIHCADVVRMPKSRSADGRGSGKRHEPGNQ